ncbi:MAG: hypothetical protein GY732_19170, partial [Gammaproteobacteria bacterium]|nr:hypothetical protein [Gammaproteobacteria bacterium]
MLLNFQLKNTRQRFRLLVFLLVISASTPGWTAIDETVEQLRLDYAAFRAAEDDYRQQRQFNGLTGADAADYATYVARLQRRVFEDCQVVIRGGSSLPEGLPCPVQGQVTTKSADIATQTEQTPQEQIAALDRMLNAGLGEYDERLLREQERIKAATPNDNSEAGGDGGAGDGSADGSEGDGSEGEGSEGEGSEGGSEGEGQETGGSPGRNREGGPPGDQREGGPEDSSDGSGENGSDRDQPSDIPDGSDDDVVARQLR